MTIGTAAESEYSKIDWISTGLPNLDKILGGGIPTKRITEISGPYSVGKTTLALTVVAQALKEKRSILWCDQEWSYDLQYAETLGADPKRTAFIQEEFAETALDLIEGWARTKRNSLIVIDAIGALLPRAEAEKDAGGKTIGGQASLVAKFCRKIVPVLAINNNALIVINHQFIDIMSGRLKTSGGAKLEYHKSLWVSLRKISNKKVMRGEIQIGIVIEAEVKKTKLGATQGQTTEMMLLFGEGFNKEANLVDEAIEKGVITKKGQFYHFGEERWRGMNALREALKDEVLSARIKDAIQA